MIKRLDGFADILLKDQGHEEMPSKAMTISEEAVASLGGVGALSPASTHESWEVPPLPGAAVEPLRAHMKVQTMIQQLQRLNHNPGIDKSSDFLGGEYRRKSKDEMRPEMDRDADSTKVKQKFQDKSDVLDPINQ